MDISRIVEPTQSPPPPKHRTPSTPGMDTLAEAASMAQPQPSPQPHQQPLQHLYHHLSPAAHPPPYQFPDSREPPQPPPQRRPTPFLLDPSPAMLPEMQQAASRLNAAIQADRLAYSARVELIRLLHHGFVNHVYPPSAPESRGDPRSFAALRQLAQAREELSALFALGEELWAEWIQDESVLAANIEERVRVLELCRRSVDEEFGSARLWVIYGEWMLYLYEATRVEGVGGGWSDEDKAVGRDVFAWQSVMDVWKRAADCTAWRIGDSHLVWDRYLELALQDLSTSPGPDRIAEMRAVFTARLQIPHRTWDNTFQLFSSFISTYYNTSYEAIMVDTRAATVDVRAAWDLRQAREDALRTAAVTRDALSEWYLFREYLEWELSLPARQRSFTLTAALYERALLRTPMDANLWMDYVLLLIENGPRGLSVIPAIERATRHCPWSGELWSQYILAAEREGQSFYDISQIKHTATSTGIMEAYVSHVIHFFTTYCSYLHRRAFQENSTDEHVDVAEVGIRSTIGDVREICQSSGQEVPRRELFRIERMYVQYLSDSGSWDTAREFFKSLVPSHGDRAEFWLTYYTWEIQCWNKFTPSDGTNIQRKTHAPSYATAVLKQALARTDLDDPDRLIATYLAHCEDYEDADELQAAVIEIRKTNRRREREKREQEWNAYYLQQAAPEFEAAAPNHHQLHHRSGKRKRPDSVDDWSAKRARSVQPEPVAADAAAASAAVSATAAPVVGAADMAGAGVGVGSGSGGVSAPPPEAAMPKRDREHASVLVKNLPDEITVGKLRNFFRDCGKINTVKVLPGDGTRSAFVEFDSRDDALAAQTRDQKSLGGYTVAVEVVDDSTLFVTNFPPTADEAYIRRLFQEYGDILDVRFPSLKYNTHRRFCYVQFVSSGAAHAASAALDGKELDGLVLTAKISDPARRADRSDAAREGRELHVSNVDFRASERDLADLFRPYGAVETVRLPRKVDGGSKGFGFVLFARAEEAEAALALNETPFRGRPLHVRAATAGAGGAKRQATTVMARVRASLREPATTNGANSPAGTPEPGGASSSSTAAAAIPEVETTGDRPARTVALLGVPDTVNDARIRALAEAHGPLVKVSLRPDHQGAIIEYASVADAGRAALALDGATVADNRQLRVGSVAELMRHEAEKKTVDRRAAGSKGKAKDKGREKEKETEKGKARGGAKESQQVAPPPPIRRPAQPGSGGRRGGLGRKLGGVPGGSVATTTVHGNGHGNGAVEVKGANGDGGRMEVDAPAGGGVARPKSNGDFRALLHQARGERGESAQR